ncbi:hypothetical protein [Nostoc sp.]
MEATVIVAACGVGMVSRELSFYRITTDARQPLLPRWWTPRL